MGRRGTCGIFRQWIILSYETDKNFMSTYNMHGTMCHLNKESQKKNTC